MEVEGGVGWGKEVGKGAGGIAVGEAIGHCCVGMGFCGTGGVGRSKAGCDGGLADSMAA